MKVLYIGKKKDSKKKGKLCGMDVVTQSDIEDEEVVVVLKAKGVKKCYALEGLAFWFLEQTVGMGKEASLPDTREMVPVPAYRTILDAAIYHVKGFQQRLSEELQNLNEERSRFVMTGGREADTTSSPSRTRSRRRRSSPSPSPPRSPRMLTSESLDDLFTEEEILSMYHALDRS